MKFYVGLTHGDWSRIDGIPRILTLPFPLGISFLRLLMGQYLPETSYVTNRREENTKASFLGGFKCNPVYG